MSMKTATLPSLRVEPALRDAAESVLQEGETLSSFVESAVREQVQLRRQREAFIARGLAALDDARKANDYLTPGQSLARLDAMLKRKKRSA
jgi:hypothetical protein